MPERTERVQQLGMRELSSLGPNHSPNAFGVSANGNVAVGYSGPSPVRWVGNGAAQDLLLEALGIDTTGWEFEVLAGISGDGTTLVGRAAISDRKRVHRAPALRGQRLARLGAPPRQPRPSRAARSAQGPPRALNAAAPADRSCDGAALDGRAGRDGRRERG